MLYLNEKDLVKIGYNWNATIDNIEQAVHCLEKKDFVQPVKPYLRYRDQTNRIIALIAFVNGILGRFGLSLEAIFGAVFAPVAWLLGVPYHDCASIGNLLGTRLVLNEFIAFQALGPMKAGLDPRSFVIATYALCGFANFSSIAIQIGGIGALAPSRKSDLARLGLRAVAAGTMANFMTACIAGMLL